MIIGIDLGGMSAKAALLAQGQLKGKSRVATSASASAEQTALSLAELALQVAEKANKSMDDVQAIGIGSPGVIDSADGNVVLWSNFHWENVPLGALVEKYTGKKTFIIKSDLGLLDLHCYILNFFLDRFFQLFIQWKSTLMFFKK